MDYVRHAENLQEYFKRQIARDNMLEPITMNLGESDSEEFSDEDVCAFTQIYINH
jgi:hypothetical protein